MALLQEQLIFGGVLLLMLCSEGPVAVVWQLKPEHGCEIRLCSHMVVAGCEILSGSGSDSTGPRTAGPEWGKKGRCACFGRASSHCSQVDPAWLVW